VRPDAKVVAVLLIDVLVGADMTLSINSIYRLALRVCIICVGVCVSGLTPSGLPVTSPSALDLQVLAGFPANTSLLCPAACQCSVIQSSSGSARRTAAACDKPIHDDDRFDPETEAVHVTGNCHRSFASVLAAAGTLAAPRDLWLRRCHLYTVEDLVTTGDAVNWGTVFELDVGFNLVTRVHARAFVRMSSLRTLVLTHNRIESIGRDAAVLTAKGRIVAATYRIRLGMSISQPD